ncbi:MAG: hypothetical protein ACRECX_05525 [Methyloceanibacter sp.]|uniref:hypothetical protein n=1 Tax=Methyloceanibacter sp. TaxID=1965321 RepID=UPI003D6D2DBD
MAALNPRDQSDFHRAYEMSPLADLTKAFEASWEVLKSHDPFRDPEKDDDLKLALRSKLLALAADGLSDPDQLRRLALENLPLTRSVR